jgi:hypothetical protein
MQFYPDYYIQMPGGFPDDVHSSFFPGSVNPHFSRRWVVVSGGISIQKYVVGWVRQETQAMFLMIYVAVLPGLLYTNAEGFPDDVHSLKFLPQSHQSQRV